MRYNIWTLKDYTLPDLSGYSSSNTYRVEASTFGDAQAAAYAVCNMELAVLGNNVILDRYRIRDDSQGVGDGYYSGSFGPGSRAYPHGELGFLTWAVLVNTYGDGRLIGRKWLRLGLMPHDLVDGDLDPALVAYVQENYADPLASAGVYRTRGDALIDAARVDPHLRLYGLRHGTRRVQELII